MTPNRTKIDWFAASVRAPHAHAVDLLKSHFSPFGQTGASSLKRGRNGFESGVLIEADGFGAATVSFGGKQQNDWVHVELSGKSCQLLGDRIELVANDVEGLGEAKLKRLDIAADFYDGAVCYEGTLEAYSNGAFSRGGRPPKATKYEGVGNDSGRTFYVGARGNDCFFRGYEKGRQCLAELFPDESPAETYVDHDGGRYRLEDWFRCEIELRDKTRPIPFEAVAQRDAYFTGAYPYLQSVYPGIEPELILTPQRCAHRELEVVLDHCKRMFGTALFSALHVETYEGKIALLERILGDRHNENLVRSGLFLEGVGA